jgi:hypothetical protein
MPPPNTRVPVMFRTGSSVPIPSCAIAGAPHAIAATHDTPHNNKLFAFETPFITQSPHSGSRTKSGKRPVTNRCEGRCGHAAFHRHIGRHNAHGSSLVVKGLPARPSQSVLMSPLRTAAPCGRPAHGMGDGAGRSPGSRVVAFARPSRIADFAALQWSSADEGSPLTVAGAATDYCEKAATVFPLSSPARPGEPTRAGSFLRPVSESRRPVTKRRALRESRRFEWGATQAVTKNALSSCPIHEEDD